MKQRIMTALAALILVIGLLPQPARGAEKDRPEEALAAAAAYLTAAVPTPGVASVGGEWAVVGLARSGVRPPEGYAKGYPAALAQVLEEGDGTLNTRKHTEYSRAVLAVTALGKDAADWAGCNLTAPLGDYAGTVRQGLGGAIWALLALDCGDYPTPAGGAVRQDYVKHILFHQRSDGSVSLTAAGDLDLTAMAVQALAKYRSQTAVAAAVERALGYLSDAQGADGGWGGVVETTAQVVVALGELGLAQEDTRFVKNGNSPLDALLAYQRRDGSFPHTVGGEVSLLATEQGLYALAAAVRQRAGDPSLYRMAQLYADRHGDVAAPAVGRTSVWSDLRDSPYRQAVDALASRGIVTGGGDGLFRPRQGMTRAEFCAVVVRALGLVPRLRGTFSDVGETAWYAGYVDTAAYYGLVTGVGGGRFAPLGSITRQEGAVLVARAGALCGGDTAGWPEIEGIMMTDWARDAVNFCCGAGVLERSRAQRPEEKISRGELCQMVYLTLRYVNLLDEGA